MSLLLVLILIPLVAAAIIPAVPRKSWPYPIALIGTLLSAAVGVVAAFQHDWLTASGKSEALAFSAPWMPKLGLSFSLGVNSVSGLLIALTLLLGPICVVASRTAITERVRTYYFWLLVLQAAMVGVFSARDLVLFYIFFEFTLIPMFVLIGVYGSTNRRAAAIKFFMYTFTGSVIALAGLLYVAYRHTQAPGNPLHAWSFDIDTLAATARAMTTTEQYWVFGALMAGFAVKVPLFPLHTWLPLAHTEAPTAGSVILAGVLLKLGTYAIYSFVLPFVPAAAFHFAPLIATFAIIGIIAVGLVCWVQRDVKKLVAYSSVAHLGFCMLGMFALNITGLKGSVLYMINHGLSTGAIFLCIGMVYERYHTRSMDELGGLAKKMPIWASFMVFFAMASVGLPMLNGFVSEFMCLMGAWQASDSWTGWGLTSGTAGVLGPVYATVAGTGMIIAAIYTLYMIGKVVWGPLHTPGHDGGHGHGHGSEAHGVLPVDLSRREIGLLLPLAACCLLLGLYPKPFLAAIDASTRDTVAVVAAGRNAHAAPSPQPAAAQGAPAAQTVSAEPSMQVTQ
ncbi:MAG TPA: NADH-quinone oxidoreductase subunit M [Phycisphaerales bacterium]|nr:NADH-quinone oxidoreductase subunit M [Phycisphaerales bacterium]